LLGQLTEPERESFWDPDSGDVDDAIEAVNEAERLTAAEFWTEDCDVIPGHPVSAFLAYQVGNQAFVAQTWNKLGWDTFEYSHNDPGFDLDDNIHYPIPEGKEGLWHYDVGVIFVPSGNYWACRAREEDADLQMVRVDQTLTGCNLSFDYDWGEGGTGIAIEVWPGASGGAVSNGRVTWFSGHYLGETS
jgi:hypothetical protein